MLNDNTTETSTSDKSKVLKTAPQDEKNIKQLLIRLKETEKKLDNIMTNELTEQMATVDNMLPKFVADWEELQKKHFADLEIQLKDLGIALTSETKNELFRCTATNHNIDETRADLEKKLNTKIPKDTPLITIAAYVAIIAGKGPLQKIDFSSTKDIVKKLDVIKAYTNATDKFRKQVNDQLQQDVTKNTNLCKSKVEEFNLPSDEEIDNAKQIKQEIAKLTKSSATPINEREVELDKSG